MSIPRKTQTRALKARARIYKIVSEIKAWKGEAPTRVRVNAGDFLALTEVGWLDSESRLSGTDLEVLIG